MSEIRVKRKHPATHEAARFSLPSLHAPMVKNSIEEAQIIERKIPSNTEAMMIAIKTILSQQIERIRLSSHSRSLTSEEVSALRDYTRNLIELNKDEREMIKADTANLDGIDTEALIARLKSLDPK